MALLDIRVLGDPILRERTTPVVDFTDELQTLIDDMFETMHAAEGIGLAAPQVGRSERVAVIDVDGQQFVIINPEIVVDGSATEKAEEGCLSIPEVYGAVERPARITLKALDRTGAPFELSATGLLARCLQHEIDHLNGKLFIDYLSLLKRRSAARRWDKEVEHYPNFIRKLEPGADRPRKSRSRSSAPAPNAEP